MICETATDPSAFEILHRLVYVAVEPHLLLFHLAKLDQINAYYVLGTRVATRDRKTRKTESLS